MNNNSNKPHSNNKVCTILDLRPRLFAKARQNSDIMKLYAYRVKQMNKPQLLEELMRYHESFKSHPGDVDNTIRGQLLMKTLEERSELKELRELAKDFSIKLRKRLETQLNSNSL